MDLGLDLQVDLKLYRGDMTIAEGRDGKARSPGPMRERKLIPIYDDTAPIACTISDVEIPERLELIERMRDALTTIARTADGLLLQFPDRADIRADLATFVVDEKRCCQFWGFEIVAQRNGVALRWDGPPAANELLDTLHTYFTSDDPVSILDGLL